MTREGRLSSACALGPAFTLRPREEYKESRDSSLPVWYVVFLHRISEIEYPISRCIFILQKSVRRLLLAYGRSIIRAKTQARKTKIVSHVTSPTHIFGGSPVHHPQSLQGCVLNSPIEVKVPIALISPPVLDLTLHYTAFQPHGFGTDRAVLTYSSPYHLPTSSNTCSPYHSQCCCPKSTPKALPSFQIILR